MCRWDACGSPNLLEAFRLCVSNTHVTEITLVTGTLPTRADQIIALVRRERGDYAVQNHPVHGDQLFELRGGLDSSYLGAREETADHVKKIHTVAFASTATGARFLHKLAVDGGGTFRYYSLHVRGCVSLKRGFLPGTEDGGRDRKEGGERVDGRNPSFHTVNPKVTFSYHMDGCL